LSSPSLRQRSRLKTSLTNPPRFLRSTVPSPKYASRFSPPIRTTTLSPFDFAIVDNDRVLPNFRSFNHSDQTSLDLVVLVDMSKSIAPRFRATINDVFQLVAREQSIPDDNLSVISFGGSSEAAPRENSADLTSTGTMSQTSATPRPAVLCSSGCRAANSTNRIQSAHTSGTTPLYDALIFGSDFLSHHHRPAARRVLILFSDGNDTNSLHSSHDALRSALDAGALIYSVDMGTAAKQSSGHRLLETSGALSSSNSQNKPVAAIFPRKSLNRTAPLRC
jgi:hypothetical protein